MTATVDIQETYDSLIIVIKPQPKGILKFGMWFFYTIPLALLAGMLFSIIGQNGGITFNVEFAWIILIYIGAVLFILSSLRKIYEKEIITVTSDSLVLSNRFIFKKPAREFKRNEIKDLKVLGAQNFTKHPLDTNGFDYLGMATFEKEVHFLIEDGKIGFQYNGETQRFGKNIWEDDGIEIINRIEKYWS